MMAPASAPTIFSLMSRLVRLYTLYNLAAVAAVLTIPGVPRWVADAVRGSSIVVFVSVFSFYLCASSCACRDSRSTAKVITADAMQHNMFEAFMYEHLRMFDRGMIGVWGPRLIDVVTHALPIVVLGVFPRSGVPIVMLLGFVPLLVWYLANRLSVPVIYGQESVVGFETSVACNDMDVLIVAPAVLLTWILIVHVLRHFS